MKQLLILSIFLTSIFAQGQMQRKNAEDMEKMEMRKKRMEQLQDKKESTMIGIQTNYLDLFRIIFSLSLLLPIYLIFF